MQHKFFLFRMLFFSVMISLLVAAVSSFKNPGPLFAGLWIGSWVVLIIILYQPDRRDRMATAFQKMTAVRILDVVLWNSLLGLLIAEGLLIGVGQFVDHPLLFHPNAKSHYRIHKMRPQGGTITYGTLVNSGGYNDTEWSRLKEPNTLRILALGDSFTFGIVGYKRNFATRLESDLTQRLGAPVEIINMGIPGTQPADYLQLLNDEGLSWDPDLILVSLYTGNDIKSPRIGSRAHIQNWRFFTLVHRLVILAQEQPDLGLPSPDSPDIESFLVRGPTFSKEVYDQMAARSLAGSIAPLSKKFVRNCKNTLRILEAIVERARPRPVVFCMFPSEAQVNPNLRAELLPTLGIKENDLDLNQVPNYIRNHFIKMNVPVFNLLPELLIAEASGRTYHIQDTHWNERGNRIVADALALKLEPILQSIIKPNTGIR